MPVRTMFSHTEHLVTVAAEGIIFSADIAQLLQHVEDHGARSYAQLIDIRRVTLCVVPAGEETLAALATRRLLESTAGAIAVVFGNSRLLEELASGFAETVAERRPVKVFRDEPSALAWLETQIVRR